MRRGKAGKKNPDLSCRIFSLLVNLKWSGDKTEENKATSQFLSFQKLQTPITPHNVLKKSFNMNVKNKTTRGWRDVSVVKNTGCSSRGLGTNSQQPQSISQPSIVGSDACFWNAGTHADRALSINKHL